MPHSLLTSTSPSFESLAWTDETTAADAPKGLRQALGVPLAADVHRTYTLERLGYSVTWSAIPSSITPMNRILIAQRRAQVQSE